MLAAAGDKPPLDDRTINEKLDQPIGARPFEEAISPGESVLIVVPDATRSSGSVQIVNLLVRRLIANGTMPHEISIIFATGIHRSVTPNERNEILTPFITQRIRTIDHRGKRHRESRSCRRDERRHQREFEWSGSLTVTT